MIMNVPCRYVRCVVNSNWKLRTTEKWQHRFGITGNIACVPIHAFVLSSNTCLFFQWSFAQNLNNISPIIWYCCNIWRPYKISNILYKTNKKAVFFINNIQHVMWPFLNAFILLVAWRVFVWKHWKVCCSLLQWSDIHTGIWCRTCTVCFFRSLLRIFLSFPPIWVCEMKVLWKVTSSHAEDLRPIFLILSRVQHEEFYYDKAISCKSYVQLLIQDVFSVSSKTCQL